MSIEASGQFVHYALRLSKVLDRLDTLGLLIDTRSDPYFILGQRRTPHFFQQDFSKESPKTTAVCLLHIIKSFVKLARAALNQH